MAGTDATPTGRLRNVALVGHGGTGKTALAEALLTTGGVGSGRGGILDFEPEERDRGHSLGLAVASFPWRDHTITLLDCPGGADSVGDAYPALPAADVAVFVVNATQGVQPQHDQLWAACEKIGLPRVVFLNTLDKEGAAYQRTIDALRERYGKPLAPVQMPIGVERDFNGVIDLLHFQAVLKGDDGRVVTEVPEDRRGQAERNREILVEAIVENDDALLERYLEGEIPDAEQLRQAFATGIASCGFFPVLCGSATEGVGVRLLADFLVEECPSPADRGATDGPPAVYVAKTLSDPYVGRINILRVLSGPLHADDVLESRRTGNSARLHQLFTLVGKEQTPITEAPTGSICAVAKLDDVITGDVLAAKGAEVDIEPLMPPPGYHRVAVVPASAGDEDKLMTALARLAEEDPALRVEQDPDIHQVILHTYGPGQVDVTRARLERKFGVRVETVPVKIAYRETLKGKAEGLGRHVKQSGGHGQYGIATIVAEPLPRGAGFEFSDEIVGGVIPRPLIPSVEKGVQEAMRQGVLAGYPVVDVRVRLIDGKHHPVDSSDMAFQVAGSLAFRAAAEKAGINLLEPILEVEVTVPDELTGDVMGDLSARRGRIQGTEPAAPGRTLITAHVPEAEMLNYTAELRSLTSGAGTVVMRYHHHEEVPDHIAKKVVEEAQQAANA